MTAQNLVGIVDLTLAVGTQRQRADLVGWLIALALAKAWVL